MRRRWYYFKRMLQADRLFVAQMIGNIIRMIQYAGRWIVLAVVCVAALYLGRGLCAGAWKDFYENYAVRIADDVMRGFFINYNYFGVTTAEISKTHQADGTLLLPECTATADNYYVREGKYITEWEPEVIGQIYGAAYRNGAVTEEIRFSDISLYDQAKAYLIDEQHIRDYCEGITGLSYIEDRDQNVLILKFS